MKENKASINIQAPPCEVWKVLTDLAHYHEWNPVFVDAKGIVDEPRPPTDTSYFLGGESLKIKMRLPLAIFCGTPLTSSQTPKITKIEHESCLEWVGPATFMGLVKGTHFFQLVSTNGGEATEFTQGERYMGWATGLFSSCGAMEDAYRGFVAMNNALQLETMRRRGINGEKFTLPHNQFSLNSDHDADEKSGDKESDEEITQLDISDRAAVDAAVTTTATTDATAATAADADVTLQTDEEVQHVVTKDSAMTIITSPPEKPAEKPVEKRTSIIGAVSSLFSSSRHSIAVGTATATAALPPSSSREDLISKSIHEDPEGNAGRQSIESAIAGGQNDDDEEEYEDKIEDSVAKMEREARNAERIELDLGSSDLGFGDFGI
ncbi:hypothetical protein EDD11_006528 [Mortierella claussenii]|nr:hypothetical protein EDD11_006528 [Mortierella claussenii]